MDAGAVRRVEGNLPRRIRIFMPAVPSPADSAQGQHGSDKCGYVERYIQNILMLKTYSKSQLIPTNKIAAGTTILIHQ